jgi:hypothetical protein
LYRRALSAAPPPRRLRDSSNRMATRQSCSCPPRARYRFESQSWARRASSRPLRESCCPTRSQRERGATSRWRSDRAIHPCRWSWDDVVGGNVVAADTGGKRSARAVVQGCVDAFRRLGRGDRADGKHCRQCGAPDACVVSPQGAGLVRDASKGCPLSNQHAPNIHHRKR